MSDTANLPSTADRTADAFIGAGIRFPLEVDHTGSLAWATGPDALDRSLRVIIATAKGERAMRPEFGCAIWELLFAPVNANTLGLMAQATRDAIGQWEPRVALEDVAVTPDPADPALVLIEVNYRVKATNDRRNLVYPFYTIPEERNP
ncbi:MAG TPA: GPW/gp25 family protein [Acidimicrobiia bacterium]|nr:GPW/gp25 family protein [Acidimicrobiia bacterium]